MLMSTNFRFSLLLARLAFLAAFPLGFGTHIAHAQQQLYPSLKDSVPNITTNGVASAEVVPDIATISIGVDTERPNAADAARDNAAPRRRSSARSRHRGLRQKTSRLCQSYSRRFTTSRPTPMAVSSSGPCAVTMPTIR